MLRGIVCAVLLTSALSKYTSVVQVTCPKSCTSCQCKGCKNITLPLGKCVGAGQGAGVIGSCSGDGAKFTEDIYFNAKCQGQAATKSVINTDACIEGSETHEEVAFFCSNEKATEEKDQSFVHVASATSPAKDALAKMRELMPQDVKDGNVEKWARETLAKQQQPEAGKPHILVIGDSWADVVGGGGSTGQSFLMRRLKAHGCTATSSCIAIPSTTASMWASAPFIAATKAAAKTADYVYVMLVGNDALDLMPDCAGKEKKTAEQCADELMAKALPQLYKIVDAIHDANPKARVTGFGYDTMFGAKGCGAITHDVFPQCWGSSVPAGQGNRCFNTQFLRIQEAWEFIAGNRSFVDKSVILGATQVAGGDTKASTETHTIDMDKMGPGKYWPLTMECFHPSVDNCGDDVNDCGATVVMEEFYKNYWSKQAAVCPSAQSERTLLPFATARSALAEAPRSTKPETGYYSFTFTGDGCGGQCPTSGCYQEDLNCESCLESWHSFPPDPSYKYGAIVSHGCAGQKVDCAECQGMMGLSRYSATTAPVPFAAARAALAEAPRATKPETGYYSFTFTGDGCGGQCPTSGCYQEDLNCESCLESWHSFPPDPSYKYGAIVSHGCAGKKVDCAECQGMMGLSRYSATTDIVV